MRKALATASLLLSLTALAGCVGPQEEAAAPEYGGCHSRGQASEQAVSASVPTAAAKIGGTWLGRACQSDGPCFDIQIALAWDEDGQPIGNIAYPTVPCKAHLEFVRWEQGGVAAFRERFENAGRCVPDGWLRLRMIDEDSLGFEWAYPNGRVDVGTTLDRAE
jgi:hypothetical protein